MNENSQIGRRFQDFRADFIEEVIKIDEEKGIYTFAMMPDPRQFESIQHNGEPHYRDRFRNFIISQKVLLGGLAEQGPNVPGYHLAPRIDSSIEYAEERTDAVQTILDTGEVTPPKTRPLPSKPLEFLTKQKRS